MSKVDIFLNTQHSLGKKAVRNYRLAMKKFENLAEKPFEQVYLDQEKVHEILNLLSKEFSPSSWNLYVILYKRYSKWLCDPDDEVYPKFWRKIKLKKIDWEKKLKNKFLTKKQFFRLLDVIDNPRDKAMFGVAVEGALRPGELLELQIIDIRKTNYGYDITVSGKTGTSSVPMVLFAPLLTQWLNQHPFKREPLSPLWTRRRGKTPSERRERLKEVTAFGIINKYAKLAGLPHISLHWLRHTKITWTAKDKNVRISDEMAKKMFRWSKNSTMYSRYTHLHGVDSKNSYLALAGVKEIEVEEGPSILEPQKCLNCQEINSAEFLYCSKCGFVLSEEEARKMIQQKKLQEAFMKLAMEKLNVDKELEDLEKSNKRK